MDGIGTRIYKIRKKDNCSQAFLAKAMGIKQSHVSKIETGKAKPSNQFIKSFCRIFDLNEEWLRYGTGATYNEILLLETKRALGLFEKSDKKYKIIDDSFSMLDVYMSKIMNWLEDELRDNYEDKLIKNVIDKMKLARPLLLEAKKEIGKKCKNI